MPTSPRKSAAHKSVIETVDRTSLTGGLLIATPRLPDPNFQRMVVLIVQHDDNGALGIVLGPPSNVTIRDICPPLEVTWTRSDSPPVRYGGPCEPQRIWLLLGGDAAPEDTTTVTPGIHLGSSIALLQRVAGQPRQKLTVFAGYAGWGAGQLEAEMQHSSWLTGECWPELLFNTAPDDTWGAALRHMNLSPEMMISGHGVSA